MNSNHPMLNAVLCGKNNLSAQTCTNTEKKMLICLPLITGAPLEDIAEEEEQGEEEEDADIGEDDEMADFIVDEEEVDENGAPMRYFKCMFFF